jgi:Ribbon-helix-helix protein, copG family
MSKSGHKSLRNVPEIYDEVKKNFSISLTQSAASKLDKMANSMGLSRSEFVEQIARGIIKICLHN